MLDLDVGAGGPNHVIPEAYLVENPSTTDASPPVVPAAFIGEEYNENEVAIAEIVLPAWWKRKQFYIYAVILLMLLLIIGAVAAVAYIFRPSRYQSDDGFMTNERTIRSAMPSESPSSNPAAVAPSGSFFMPYELSSYDPTTAAPSVGPVMPSESPSPKQTTAAPSVSPVMPSESPSPKQTTEAPSVSPVMSPESPSLNPSKSCHMVRIFAQHYRGNVPTWTVEPVDETDIHQVLPSIPTLRPTWHASLDIEDFVDGSPVSLTFTREDKCLHEGTYEFSIYNNPLYYYLGSNGNFIAEGCQPGFRESTTFHVPFA